MHPYAYARSTCTVWRPTESSSIARSIAPSQTPISLGPRPTPPPMCRANASTGKRRSDRPDLPCGAQNTASVAVKIIPANPGRVYRGHVRRIHTMHFDAKSSSRTLTLATRSSSASEPRSGSSTSRRCALLLASLAGTVSCSVQGQPGDQ